MEEKIKNCFIWIGVIIFYLTSQLIMPSILDRFNITNQYISNTCLVLSDIIVVTLLIIFYKKDFKKDHDDLNNGYKDKLKITIKIWLIGLIAMIISNNIINLFTASGIASNESINRTVLEELTIYAIPTMVIFGPICEEIIFRLSLKKIFSNKYLYVILSGLLFGGAHVLGTSGIELLYIIPYGALGAAFAYIYVRTKNIICPILAHMIHNFICILLILFL